MIRNIFIFFTLLNCIFSYAQKSTITGVILDELNNPIENVNIICNETQNIIGRGVVSQKGKTLT